MNLTGQNEAFGVKTQRRTDYFEIPPDTGRVVAGILAQIERRVNAAAHTAETRRESVRRAKVRRRHEK
jgi:hypothetical protein